MIHKKHAVHSLIIRRMRDVAGTDKTSLHATATVDSALQTLSREARSNLTLSIEEKALIAELLAEDAKHDGSKR